MGRVSQAPALLFYLQSIVSVHMGMDTIVILSEANESLSQLNRIPYRIRNNNNKWDCVS